MPVFVYRAADRRGQTIDGVMEAPDARAVVDRLQKDAYFPIRVAAQAERARWLAFGVSARVSQRDLLALTQQLATLVEAGLPLDRALAIQEELAPSPRLKAIVTDLLNSVRGGLSVSAGFQNYWWALVLAVLAAVLAWRVWTGTPEGRLAWDQTVLGLPIVGRLSMRVETARFARTLGTMLKSGVPVMGALAVVGD